MTPRSSSLKALVQSLESTAREESCSRRSWSARGAVSTPEARPRPCCPASRRRSPHLRAAALAMGRVAARRKTEGMPMGRMPNSREGGERSVGSGLRKAKRRGGTPTAAPCWRDHALQGQHSGQGGGGFDAVVTLWIRGRALRCEVRRLPSDADWQRHLLRRVSAPALLAGARPGSGRGGGGCGGHLLPLGRDVMLSARRLRILRLRARQASPHGRDHRPGPGADGAVGRRDPAPARREVEDGT
eukprot:scaffold8765_cov131-Isochrysis_galbana.AAC.2